MLLDPGQTKEGGSIRIRIHNTEKDSFSYCLIGQNSSDLFFFSCWGTSSQQFWWFFKGTYSVVYLYICIGLGKAAIWICNKWLMEGFVGKATARVWLLTPYMENDKLKTLFLGAWDIAAVEQHWPWW
jgi:hypothetical protein